MGQTEDLTWTIFCEAFADKVRQTGEHHTPGAAAAHFTFAIKESRRRAEALLDDLDPDARN